ncbi:MAG: hypothetical protein AAGJ93_12450, partial [Bacteroidota bacterium]
MKTNIYLLKKELVLRPVTTQNANSIHGLMMSCYPPVYQHLWQDQGQWYVDNTFKEKAVLQELQDREALYWIVEWQGETAGILRLVNKKVCPELSPDSKALKLHRIYL